MAKLVFLIPLALMFIPAVHGDDLGITSFTSDPASPTDSPGEQDVTLRCEVNLPSANITSVTFTGPGGFNDTVTSPASGNMYMYETTLNDVHPAITGTYTCTAAASTGGVAMASQDLQVTVVCASGYYGSSCDTECSCISGATCDPTNGNCTCSQPVCDKDDLSILSFTSDPLNPTDSSSQDDVKLRCRANLPDADVSVSVMYPGSSDTETMAYTSNGWYERTLNDVHPSDSGLYTCIVTPIGTSSAQQDTYQLTITDVDECDVSQPQICDSNAVCNNTVGGFTCTCNAGYSGDGMTCAECMADHYGVGCMKRCTCVSSGNPAPVCDKVDGSCTCTKAFTEATCDKAMLNITSFQPMSGVGPIRDDVSVNDVNMRCHVNLAESDLQLVTLTINDGSLRSMTKVEEGVWEYTLQDVHPEDSGQYTCRITTKRTLSGATFDDSDSYNLVVTDVDECDENSDNCNTYATCTNNDGGFTCTCINGFRGDGVRCDDIDECNAATCQSNCDDCNDDATCSNTIGSYSCACNAGFYGDGVICQVCASVNYGINCAENCTCVKPKDPNGPNDVTCRNTDGFCECDDAEFTGKTCDKRDLGVTLLPDPNPVLDTSGEDTVTWKCMVNLHSRDLTLPVTITYPGGGTFPMTMNGEGLYEYTLNGVTQNNNGRYTCTATAQGMAPKTGPFDLDVLIVGRIISVSDPVEGKVNHTVQINCKVYAAQDVAIKWYFGDNEIMDGNKYTIVQSSIEDFEQISYLTVINLRREDNGTYVCSASNDTLGAMITVIEEPVIAGIQVSAWMFDQLNVSWIIDFDGNLPPPNCSVEFRILNSVYTPSPGSPVVDVTHVVTGLQPYTEYYVRVRCTNKVGPSNEIQSGPVRTLATNPSRPRNLAYISVLPESFVVTWDKPAMENGPVDFYTVSVSRTSDGQVPSIGPVQGRSALVEGLTAYTNYTVEVTALNTEGGQDLPSPPAQEIFRTAQDAPTPPVNVQTVDRGDTCEISWERPENENGIIQSYTVHYSAYPRPVGNNTPIDQDSSGMDDINNGAQMTFTFIKSEHANYSEYQFRISATTVSTGNPSAVGNGSCITPPAAPAEGSVAQPVPGEPVSPDEEAITSTTFYMAVAPADERNGPISCYDIIVKELLENEDISTLDPDRDFPQDQVGDYGDSQDTPGRAYVAFVKQGSLLTEPENIKIGADRVTRCGVIGSRRRKRQVVYDHTGDNGRLKYETKYTAFVRAFVKVGDGMEEVYTSSPFMQPVTTYAGPSVVGIVIGVILAVLIVVVLVLGALIYMKRRKQIPLLHEGENGVAMVPVTEKEPEVTHMVVLPITLENLSETVRQKSENDDEIFKAEFKSIPEATGDVTRDATNLECNREKNRYINIGAYDHTRVRLSPIEGEEGSDYINACFVDGYEKPRKFIAAQGAREDTVLDFWRMVWEQNCATIIMLTKCLENGREKCAEYWPEEDAIMYDDIIVTLDDVVTCADYVIRKFTLQKHIETDEDEDEDAEPIIGESRTLMQFHFLGWPDFGIPKYPHSMLCFVKRIRHMTGSRIEPGNIVVHCSAGVGRTGTYILIDSMLDMMKKEKKVDIYNVIYKLRNQRNLLVQSLVQYIFIHKALMEEFLYGHTEVDVGSFHIYNQKLCSKKSDADDAGVDTEYRTVASLPVDNTDQKTGNIEANKHKNRIRQVIPYDRNRVKLERLTGQEHSNYINASFIDGYEHKKAYIAAQGPLPNTMGDFWRMAWENQCSTIVMLTDCEERGQNVCTKYWPESGETLNPAFLVVSVKDCKEEEDCTIRDLEVSTTKGAGTKLIRQYHYHGWPEVGVPDNSASLVKVIGLAHEYQQDIGRFPILVHCSAGSGRTGVFITLSYLLQRAKAEGIVDVFQAVRTLRQQRPHMVQDVAQYQFCYRAMMEYLDSFDHYANFK